MLIFFIMNKEVLKNIFTKGILNPFIPRYEKALYYEPGDTFKIQSNCSCPAFVSSGSTNVELVFTTEKSMKNISTIKIKDISGGMRSIEGYMRPPHDTNDTIFVYTDFTKISATKISNNLLRIDLSITDGYKITASSNTPNNRPVIVTLTKLELEFSDTLSDTPNIEEPDIFD